MLTKAMATAIPAGCPTKSSPTADPALPRTELRETNPNIAIPAAECGITTGRSIIPVTSRFRGNSLRAIRYEKGMAAKENTSVAAIETHKVSQMLSRTSASRQVSTNSVDCVAKNIPSNGASIKSNTCA